MPTGMWVNVGTDHDTAAFRPLTSHEVILESIAATTTRTGLRVKAELDTSTYPTGIGVGDAEMAALPLMPAARLPMSASDASRRP